METPEAEAVVTQPNPPVYVPADCTTNPTNFYGNVVVPADLGTGVKSASDPVLIADNTVWSVVYTLKDSSAEFTYSWPNGGDGQYEFQAVPLSDDELYITDSVTGVGACELSDTGAADYILPIGGGALLLGIGVAATYLSRRSA